jgi:hypothetical protein
VISNRLIIESKKKLEIGMIGKMIIKKELETRIDDLNDKAFIKFIYRINEM